ncbi:MAG: PilZ domain-containing protein [candidate division Zixibacteria bacterium]|nr:PilZ domain-containing protein [candidate division Zixibacteria bacterium]
MNDRRQNERRASENYLAVFDSRSGRRIGELANLSDSGAMLITLEPVKSGTFLHCLVKLHHPILGRSEIEFDAECRWCRRNVARNRWESGYQLHLSGINEEMVAYLGLSFALGTWEIPGEADVKTITLENRRNIMRYAPREDFPVLERHNSRRIGRMANLSTNGVGLYTPEPVEPGTVFQGRVKLPRMIFQREYLLFEAECRWCRKNEDGVGYKSGYLFTSVSEHDAVLVMHLIIHYLDELPEPRRYKVVR